MEPAGAENAPADRIPVVKLDRAAYGGEALGRLPDGRAVFVPFGLPGETVSLELIEERPRYARARIREVLEEIPQRVAPRCRHFGVCGGCHYQHLAYVAQLKLKADVVRDQLLRVGGLKDPNVLATVASPLEWRYRNHVQFHPVPPSDGESETCRLGMVAAMSQTSGNGGTGVIPLEECFLADEVIDSVWRSLELDPQADVSAADFRSGADGDLMLILESESPDAPEMDLEAGFSVAHLSPWGALTLAGSPDVLMRVKGSDFRVSAGSFFQVNTGVAALMVDHLLEILPLKKSARLLDVYCGAGLFSAFLAPHVAEVTGIEESPSACADFEVNLEEFDNVSLYEAPAEDVLPQLDVRVDLAIVDPPRAGMERKALQALLHMQPETIAYVSCDPATLARDLKHIVAGGYEMRQVTPFDMFPQTYHVETVALLKNNRR